MTINPDMSVPSASMNGNLGSRLKRYPADVGIGNETNDEKVMATERILALAFGSTNSISFIRKVLDTEKLET